jgi:predicted MPP superfamily phosphohydrolase
MSGERHEAPRSRIGEQGKEPDGDPDWVSFTFAHLSDIHFAGYAPNAVFDVDSDIRMELALDLEQLAPRSSLLDAILIGGDIAGKGKEAEYNAATTWIEELCEKFDIPEDHVYCVPGNHDVDQAKIREDPVLAALQQSLLRSPITTLDAELEALTTDKTHPGQLFRGLDAYNLFAARYRCAMGPDEQHWAQTIEVGGLKIHLVGLCSALLCGPTDSREAEQSQLALGPQGRLHRFADNTFTVMLCHHPPDWLRDREELQPFLERAQLQLYGHQHSFDLQRSGAGIRVDAGAVHPARGQDPWQPSYNLISLHWRESNPSEVFIDFYARRLGADQTFGPVDEEEEMRREKVTIGTAGPAGLPPVPPAPSPEVDPAEERKLARDFVALGSDRRRAIGEKLGLIGPSDEKLPEGMRLRRIFEVARQGGHFAELREQIDA